MTIYYNKQKHINGRGSYKLYLLRTHKRIRLKIPEKYYISEKIDLLKSLPPILPTSQELPSTRSICKFYERDAHKCLI